MGTVSIGGLRVDMSMGVAELVQGIAEAKSALSDFQASVITLNQGFELATTAFNTFKEAAGSVFEALDQAASVDRVTESFKNLNEAAGANFQATLNDLRTATNGTISDMGLMTVDNHALMMGMNATNQSFMDFAAAAIKVGAAMNKSPEEALTLAINDVAAGTDRMKKSMGVIYDTWKTGEPLAAAVARGMQAVKGSAAELPAPIENAATANEQLDATIKNLKNSFLGAYSNSIPLQQAIQNLNSYLQAQGVKNYSDAFAALGVVIVDGILGFGKFLKATEDLGTAIGALILHAETGLSDLSKSINDMASLSWWRNAATGDPTGMLQGIIGLIDKIKEKTTGGDTGGSWSWSGLLHEFSPENISAMIGSTDIGAAIKAEVDKYQGWQYTAVPGDKSTTVGQNPFTSDTQAVPQPAQIQQSTQALTQNASALQTVQASIVSNAQDLKEWLGLNDQTNMSVDTSTIKQNANTHAANAAGAEIKNAAAGLKAAQSAQDAYNKALDTSDMQIAKLSGTDGLQALTKDQRDDVIAMQAAIQSYKDGNTTGAQLSQTLKDMVQDNVDEADSEKEKTAAVQQSDKEIALAAQRQKDYATSVQQSTAAVGQFATGLASSLGISLPSELIKGIETSLDKSGAWQKILGSLFGTDEKGNVNAAGAQMAMGAASSIVSNFISAIQTGMSNMNASKAAGGMANQYMQAFNKGLQSNLLVRGLLDFSTFGLNEVFANFGQSIMNGIFGTEDPQTQFRKTVGKYFDTLFNGQAIKMVIANQLQTVKGMDMSQYMPTAMGSGLSANAQGQFGAVADYFNQLQGGFDGFAGQMQNILEHQVGGSLINLKVLLDDLGISADQMGKQLSDSYMKGDESAKQFVADSAALGKLSSGDVGSLTQAWKDFESTASVSGNYAQESLKEIGTEASKLHATSLTQLQSQLANLTGDPTAVASFIGELQKMGITVQQLNGGLSSGQLAQMVTDLQNAGFAFTPLTQSAQDLKTTLDQIANGTYNAQMHVNVTWGSTTGNVVLSAFGNVFKDSSFSQTIKMASGGILDRPTMLSPNALAGEAGPEAIMPLTRVNGKLGVYSSGSGAKAQSLSQTVINIDARGAAPGVEARIMQAIQAAESRAVGRSAALIQATSRRGGF